MIVQERKENILNGSTDEELHDSIIFFGSLVHSAADFGRSNVQNWKPKSSLLNAIQSEVNNSTWMDRILDMNDKSHSHSLGATTISTRDMPYFGSPNLGICETIVTLTTLLQKVAIELESLHDDSESISESDYLCRLYSQ